MKSNQHTNKYNTRLHPVEDDRDYLEKINKYKKRRKIKIITGTLVLLAIVTAIFLLYYFHTFKGYKVLDSMEHSASTYVSYEMIDDLQIRYTRDGISLFEDKDNVIWSATYEMQNPQIDISGEYIIVYENNSNKVYLFNLKKQLHTFETAMPIKKACVSSKGTVALLVEEEDMVHRIRYMDSKGELIAEGRAFFNQSGYPLDMSISQDGYKLCVSYYIVDGASTKTKLTFYGFDDVGESNVDNIIAEYNYEDTIIPETVFLEDDTLIAFGDNCIAIYDDGTKPECIKKIDITKEIESIFYDRKNFGTVTKEGTKNKINVYNKKGKLISEIETEFDYTDIIMEEGNILLHNTTQWKIYLKNGFLRAEGVYDQEINQMMRIGYNRYLIVGNSKIEEIKLAD